MKVPSTGGKGGARTHGGGPKTGPRRSPELIENFFSDKSAMAKRLELAFERPLSSTLQQGAVVL